MAHFEVDCRKCMNCSGYSCRIYGEDPNIATDKCANDIFKNYIDMSNCKKCAFNSNDSYCKRYSDGLKNSIKKCNEKKSRADELIISSVNVSNNADKVDYNVLTIELTDGSTSTWKDGQWDDWDIIGDFLVVLDKDGKWIGMRNKSLVKKVDMYHE